MAVTAKLITLLLAIFLACLSTSQAQLPVTVRSKPCRKGTFTRGNTCIPCPRGTFADVEGLAECKRCPPGQTSDKGKESENDCFNCRGGRFEKDGRCVECPPLTQSEFGATECRPCPDGGVPSKSGQRCGTCPVGKVTVPKASRVTCENCPDGSTTAMRTSFDCEPCPIGTFQFERRPFRGTGLCEPCRPGEFGDEMGLPRCKRCPEGFYQNELGAKSCLRCPPNSRTTGTGSKFCRPTCRASTPGCISCPPGQGFDLKAKKCMKCPPGTVSIGNSVTPCYPCPMGEGMPNKDQTDCVCPDGQRLRKGGSCEDCPFRTRREEGGTNKCVCIIPLRDDGACACPQGEIFNEATETCEPPKVCRPGAVLVFDNKCKKCPGDTVLNNSELCTCGKQGFGLRDGKCAMCQPGEEPRETGGFNRPRVISCEPCPENTFSDTPGARRCELCPRGQRPIREGAKACLPPCPPGSDRDEGFFADDDKCRCKDGFISEGQDLNVKCTKCGQNEVIVNNKCVCPSGMFTGPGNKMCRRCPGDTFVTFDGRCECPCGSVLNKETGECKQCPAGTVDEEGECKPCPETQIAPSRGSCFCRSCKPGLVAVRGIECRRQCTEGLFRNKEGKCQACAPGERVEDFECVKCPNNAVSEGGNVKRCTKCNGGQVPNKDKNKCINP